MKAKANSHIDANLLFLHSTKIILQQKWHIFKNPLQYFISWSKTNGDYINSTSEACVYTLVPITGN
jgi:hypothetical protein